jgi:hypothetical protein
VHSHFKIGKKCGKGPLGGGRARNQHVIHPRLVLIRQDLRRNGAQAAFGPIAHDRISDFATRSEANPHAATRTRRLQRGLQHQTGCDRLSAACRDPQKVFPDSQRLKFAGSSDLRPDTLFGYSTQADSRFRPLARRAANTRRPAAVAMRARKPWRRLRTSLLG